MGMNIMLLRIFVYKCTRKNTYSNPVCRMENITNSLIRDKLTLGRYGPLAKQ